MEYLDTWSFTYLQGWICCQKLKGLSYDAISKSFNKIFLISENLSHDAIKSCLKRSSLSLRWEKSSTVGRIPILSSPDWDIFNDYIIDNAIDGQFIDTEGAIDKAEELRKIRFQKARLFLIECKCYGILDELQETYNKANVE